MKNWNEKAQLGEMNVAFLSGMFTLYATTVSH